MTAAKPKSLRRRIVSTLIWTLGLLLLTNVFWSAWAATPWGINERMGDTNWEYVRRGKSLLDQNRIVAATVFNDHLTQTIHLVDLGVPNEEENAYSSRRSKFESVVPHWVHSQIDKRLTPQPGVWYNWWFRSVGWPVRLLWEGYEPDPSQNSPVRQIRFSGIMLQEGQKRNGAIFADPDIVLPIRPIWTGQLFYTTFWLGVVLIVPFTRRRFRTWRSRCTNCNYNLHANTTGVCPECGARVRTDS